MSGEMQFGIVVMTIIRTLVVVALVGTAVSGNVSDMRFAMGVAVAYIIVQQAIIVLWITDKK